MKQYDFVILGAGVAGLSFAKKISEQGYSVLVLEKEAVVGGLSRSICHEGFYLDFCAHRFHTRNEELLREVLTLPDLKMTKHIKRSRIFMFGKYLKYPFELQNLLRAMPTMQAFTSGVSFFGNVVTKKFRKKDIRSYKDWFIHFYGRRLYETMCYPYTSKIWHIDPAEISADWAEQRFQGENLNRLMKRVIKKLLTFDFSSYSLEDDRLAPDGGEFYYPQRGIQQLPEGFAAAAAANGTEIACSVVITRISKKSKTVRFRRDGAMQDVEYCTLVSTIPLHEFYDLQDIKDPEIEKSLSELKYMDIVFVYVFVNKPRISRDHWLYFPDKDIIFNRAVEFSNWSPEMCPPGKTSVCFDLTAFEWSDIAQQSDDAIARIVIDDAVRIGYLNRPDVISHLVVRIKNAYPFYDLGYRDNLIRVAGFLEDENTYLCGRTGIFRYNNSDNSIEMAFRLAENFRNGAKDRSVLTYAIKKVSY